MNESSPRTETLGRRVREALGSRPVVDWPTAAVVLAMTAGFPALGWLYHRGALPAWATVLVGTVLMNLSFTAWHEPAHRNFSTSRWLNTATGWLASLASVYPGYFARRREHLVHHRFEGVEGMDPVYPRVQANPLTFPFVLAWTALRGAPTGVPDDFLPLTRAQRISDAVSNTLALAVVATSAALGFWQAMVLAWLLPRLLVFLAHAYYVCFFPHHAHGDEGFVVWRVRMDNPLLGLLTMNQHLHGLHHRWPWIPWHQYPRVAERFPEALVEMDVVGADTRRPIPPQEAPSWPESS